MKRIIGLVLALVVILSVGRATLYTDKSFAVTGNSYYVSPTGLDTNSCSLSAPCKTFAKVVGLAIAGNTVYLRGGTYAQQLLITKSGNAGAYIVYTAYPGETPIIDGAGLSFSSGGLIDIHNANYIKINGITVNNSPQTAIYATATTNLEITNNKTNMTKISSGIGVWQSDKVLVSNNIVANSHLTSEGSGGHEESISIAGTTNFEVSYNEVYMTSTAYLGNEGIDCKHGARFGTVHNNYIHDYTNEGGGIYIDAWDTLTGNIDIYNNRQLNTANGITVGSEQGGTAENIHIYNNLIYNVGAVGIGIPTRSTAGIRRNIEIYNNTIYKARWNGGAGIYITEPKISGIIIRNNIVYFNNYNGEIVAGSSALLPYITADHNLVFGSKNCANDYPNCVEIPGSTTADPKFVSLTTPDFHLQSSSPAIDKGVSVAYITTDYAGNPRAQGVGVDIGAYEYAGGTFPTQSPAPTYTKTATSTQIPTKTSTPIPTSTITPVSTQECIAVTFHDGTKITVCK